MMLAPLSSSGTTSGGICSTNGANSLTNSEQSVVNPNQHCVLKVNASTWARDSHELFDYEATHIHKKTWLVPCAARMYRHGVHVTLVPEQDEAPSVADYLLSIRFRDGKFFVLPAERLATAMAKKVWMIVKHLPRGTHTVQENDVIKLGRFKLKVRQLVRSKENQQLLELKLDDIPIPSVTIAPEELSTKQCRICLLDGGADDDPLVCPCNCRGSIQYVHVDCLRYWINGKLNMPMSSQCDAFFFKPQHCELCKAAFPSLMYVNGERIPIVKVPEVAPPFVILENIVGATSRGMHVISMASKKDLKLGRGHESDVRIPDVSISRYHATIRFSNGEFILADHDSKFGTLVALRRFLSVDDSCNIALQIGRTVVTFSLKRLPFSPERIEQLQEDESSAGPANADGGGVEGNHSPTDEGAAGNGSEGALGGDNSFNGGDNSVIGGSNGVDLLPQAGDSRHDGDESGQPSEVYESVPSSPTGGGMRAALLPSPFAVQIARNCLQRLPPGRRETLMRVLHEVVEVVRSNGGAWSGAPSVDCLYANAEILRLCAAEQMLHESGATSLFELSGAEATSIPHPNTAKDSAPPSPNGEIDPSGVGTECRLRGSPLVNRASTGQSSRPFPLERTRLFHPSSFAPTGSPAEAANKSEPGVPAGGDFATTVAAAARAAPTPSLSAAQTTQLLGHPSSPFSGKISPRTSFPPTPAQATVSAPPFVNQNWNLADPLSGSATFRRATELSQAAQPAASVQSTTCDVTDAGSPATEDSGASIISWSAAPESAVSPLGRKVSICGTGATLSSNDDCISAFDASAEGLDETSFRPTSLTTPPDPSGVGVNSGASTKGTGTTTSTTSTTTTTISTCTSGAQQQQHHLPAQESKLLLVNDVKTTRGGGCLRQSQIQSQSNWETRLCVDGVRYPLDVGSGSTAGVTVTPESTFCQLEGVDAALGTGTTTPWAERRMNEFAPPTQAYDVDAFSVDRHPDSVTFPSANSKSTCWVG